MKFAAVPLYVFKILLVAATAIWGVSFVVMKEVVEALPPAWLLGIRFTCAGIILFAILHRRVIRAISPRVLGMGALLGLFDFLAFFTQTVGLQHTTPGINAFLTATYCVIVPFAWWILARKRPTALNIGAAAIAIAGIWLVSVSESQEGLSLGFGEGITLVCALLFAIHIVFVSKFSQRADVLVLTVIQFITEGLCGLALGACTESAPSVEVLLSPLIVGQMAFLILFASILCFGIQNVSLAYVPPAQTSLLLSLESVFGVLFSVLLYGEQVTPRLLAGFALIFIAIVLSEVFSLSKNKGEPALSPSEPDKKKSRKLPFTRGSCF